MTTTAQMLDNFVIVKGDDSGNVTLQLSNYAAWAILRRLRQEKAADDTEQAFVEDVTKKLDTVLSEG